MKLRIISKVGFVLCSTWIFAGFFSVALAGPPPVTPEPIWPADEEEIDTLTPTFQWSQFQDGGDGETQAGYQLRVRCDDEGDLIVYDTGYRADAQSSSHVYSPSAFNDPNPGFVDAFREDWPEMISSNNIWRKSVYPVKTTQLMAEHVTVENGVLILSVPAEVYEGGQIETIRNDFNYGYYEARIKASAVPGVVNGFFTHHLESGHEIDIEFLSNQFGPNSGKVNFVLHPHDQNEPNHLVVDLPFNPSDSFNNYAFSWTADSVAFYVNGVEVSQMLVSDGYPVPSIPGNLILINWNGESGWGDGPPIQDTTMEVEWVRHIPAGAEGKVSLELEWDRHYHWHVRYIDSGGDWSLWSSDTPGGHQDFYTVSQGPVQYSLSVESTPVTGVFISGSPEGITNYILDINEAAAVSLTAPPSVMQGQDAYEFARWMLNSVSQPVGQRDIMFNIMQNSTAVAIFNSELPEPLSVLSISPNWAVTGTVHIMDLAGMGFEAGADVRLTATGHDDIVGTNVVVPSSTRITCDFDITGASGGTWDVEVSNPGGETAVLPNGFTIGHLSDGGECPSIAVGDDGTVHIAHMKDWSSVSGRSSYVWYTRIEESGWSLDSVASVLENSYGNIWLGLSASDEVHIGYVEYWNWGTIWHCVKNGTWTSEVVDSGGSPDTCGFDGMAMALEDSIVHYVYEKTWDSGYKDGFNWAKKDASWDYGQLESDWFDGSCAAATDSSGNLHIVYALNDDIYYRLRPTGYGWEGSQLVHSEVGAWYHGRPGIALDSAGKVHITYAGDNLGNNPYYANNVSGSWIYSVIDSNTDCDQGFARIACGPDDSLHVAYFDTDNYKLKYAVSNGVGWDVATLADMDDFCGPDIAVDTSGTVHIAYGVDGELCYLRLPRQNRRIYVKWDASGDNDGSNWADAYNYLQDAITTAISGDEIWVAAGTYKPDSSSASSAGSGDRGATFQVNSGVVLYGGFEGDEGVIYERDPRTYETILSGDLAGNDVDMNDPCDLLNEPTRAENSYHVVTCSGTGSNTILDGFTIAGGNANHEGDYAEPDAHGGGMVNLGGSPSVMNCLFTNNSARWFGGGMWSESSSGTIIGCTFQFNSADGGGAIRTWDSDLGVTKCKFENNLGLSNGGGIFHHIGDFTLDNCLFIGNRTSGEGGAIHNVESNMVIKNCTVANNEANEQGGIFDNNGNITVTNGILWGNLGSGDMDEYAQIYTDGGVAVVTYSCIQDDDPGDGYIPFGGESNGNTDDDPLFKDAGVGDLRLLPCSACIDKGDNSGITAGVDTDLDGHLRIMDGDCNGLSTVDMGAYEFSYIWFGDFTGDCAIDLNDFGIMAEDWLVHDYNALSGAPNDANLVAWWKLDEGVGDEVNDSSGNGRVGRLGTMVGTDSNDPSWFNDAVYGWCLYFDGGDYVDCGGGKGQSEPNTWADLSGSFTLATWIKQRQWRDWGCFVTKGELAWKLQMGFSPWLLDQIHFAFPRQPDGGIASNKAISYEIWYHVAGVWDNEEEVARIYIDGVLDNFTERSGPAYSYLGNDCPVYIGARANEQWIDDHPNREKISGCPCDPNVAGGDDAIHFFDGWISDVRIYDYSLAQSEIISLAGQSEVYQPVLSPANLYDEEPRGSKIVNFKDFAVFAEQWLNGCP